MHCIDDDAPQTKTCAARGVSIWTSSLVLLGLALLSACMNKPVAFPTSPAPPLVPTPHVPPPPPPVHLPEPAPTQPNTATSPIQPTAPNTPSAPVAPAPPRAASPPGGVKYVKLPPPRPSRDMAEVRVQAAQRLVAAHPDTSYMSVPQQPLLGVPVLKVFLNRDGSVRNILVLREPREAKYTIKMAIDAVHRAAPFGDMSGVVGPWEFVETFLFEHNQKFKPMTLDR